MIRAILACDNQGGIGKANTLPWPHNRRDLEHFKKLTEGNTVVMGRGTWESNGMPRPLPKRHNIVVTSNANYTAKGADVIHHNVLDHLTTLSKSNTVFLIGGAGLINQYMNYIQIFHLTKIAGNFDCDTFIDLEQLNQNFIVLDNVAVDNKTTFETYINKDLLR